MHGLYYLLKIFAYIFNTGINKSKRKAYRSCIWLKNLVKITNNGRYTCAN